LDQYGLEGKNGKSAKAGHGKTVLHALTYASAPEGGVGISVEIAQGSRSSIEQSYPAREGILNHKAAREGRIRTWPELCRRNGNGKSGGVYDKL